MYRKCITCKRLGTSCAGPNFFAMDSSEIIEWCNMRKSYLGWSNAKIAEKAGMAKGTVDGLLSGRHMEYKYESIRILMIPLVGGEILKYDCPLDISEHPAIIAKKDEEIERLKAEKDEAIEKITQEKDEMIDRLEQENARLEKKCAKLEESNNFLRSAFNNRKKTAVILSIFLTITVVIIISALVVDALNPEFGYFWRTSAYTTQNYEYKDIMKGFGDYVLSATNRF